MPDLNQRNPFMAKYLMQMSIWWIEYVGLAGIRQDTYPYPDKHMMSDWNKLLLEEYPKFKVVGEEWSHNPGLIAYWQKGQINKDGYQGYTSSMMDFPLQNALSRSLTEKEGRNAGWKILYDALSSDFLYPDPYNLVIFPDNHDMQRFIKQVGNDQDLFKLGITYILTTRGIPQIYYGSEIMLGYPENQSGGNREDFPGGWEGDRVNGFTGDNLGQDKKVMQDFFRKLLHWRKNNPVIHRGKLIHYVPEGGVYVLGRYNEESRIIVILNQDEEDVTLELDRFSELIARHTSGREVISGRTFELGEELKVPAKTPLVLELSK
jgi:glycosidase